MTDLSITRTRSLPPAVAVAALGASSFMITLDATALHVALPTIAEDLGASLTALQWIANAYTLVFAGLLLSSGALSAYSDVCAHPFRQHAPTCSGLFAQL